MDKNGWRLKRSAHSKYLSLGYALLVLPGPHAKVSADDGAKFKSGLNADKYFPAQHWTCLKSRNFWTFDGAEDLSQIKSHPSARLRRPNWMWHRLEIKNLVPLYTFYSAASFFMGAESVKVSPVDKSFSWSWGPIWLFFSLVANNLQRYLQCLAQTTSTFLQGACTCELSARDSSDKYFP